MARPTELNPSMFSACRCAIALAYADGIFCDEERKIIDEYFRFLCFSDGQRKTIADDIAKGGVDFDTEFTKITDPRARAYFINLARILSYSDGEFCVKEKAILDRITGEYLNNMNFGTKKEPERFSVDAPSDDCKLHRMTDNKPKNMPILPSPAKKYDEVSLINAREIVKISQPSKKNQPLKRDSIVLSPEAQKLREFSMGKKGPKTGFLNYLARILE